LVDKDDALVVGWLMARVFKTGEPIDCVRVMVALSIERNGEDYRDSKPYMILSREAAIGPKKEANTPVSREASGSGALGVCRTYVAPDS
jgi:hypothetical protein